MADNKKPSTQVRRVVPNANWVNNALKSLGLGSLEVAESLMPNTVHVVRNSSKDAVDYVRQITKERGVQKKINDALKNSTVIKNAETVIKNGISDLRSGKLINDDKARQDLGLKALMGDDFDLDGIDNALSDLDDVDFGDDLFNGDEDSEEAESGASNVLIKNDNSVRVVQELSAASLEPVVNAINETSLTQAKAVQASNNILVELTGRQLFQSKEIGSEIVGHLNNMESHLAALVQYNNESMTKYIEASMAYFEKAIPKLEKPDYNGQDNDENALFDSDGKFNMKAYLSGAKESFKTQLQTTDLGQVIDFIPMLLGTMAESPLKAVTEGLIKSVIPKVGQYALTSLDKTFGSFIPSLLQAASEYNIDRDGPLASGVQLLIRSLGRKENLRTGIDIGEVKNDVVPWDNITRHSLVEIIPKYLRESNSYLKEIAETVTGKSSTDMINKAEIFNFRKGKYQRREDLQRDYFREIEDSAIEGFNSTQFDTELDAIGSELRLDKEEFNDMVNQLKFLLVQSNRLVDRERGRSSLENMINSLDGSDELKEVLKSTILDSMSSEAILSANAGVRKGIRKYNEKLNEITANAADYRLYDIYDSASLNNTNVKKDVYAYEKERSEAIRSKRDNDEGASFHDDSVQASALPGSSGNNPIGIISDIREILLRGINVRVDKVTDKLYNREISKSGVEHLQQPTGAPVSQDSNNPADTATENTNQLPENIDQYWVHQNSISGSGVRADQLKAFTDETIEDEEFYRSHKDAGKGLLDDFMPQRVKSAQYEASNKMMEYSRKGKDFMYNLIYGGPYQATNAILNDISNKAIDTGTKFLNNFVTPIKSYIFEDDETTGKKSVATKIADVVSDAGNGIQHYLFGKGYVKSDGTEIKELSADEKRENTFAGKVKTLFDSTTKGVSQVLFGKTYDEEIENEEESTEGLVGKIKDTTLRGVAEWKSLVFGKDEEFSKEKVQEDIEKVKKTAIKAIPNTVISSLGVSAVGSLAGSSLLGATLGGPVGSMIGLGIGIASSSDSFKEKVFGKEGENGEWIEGLVSKNTQNFFSENKSRILGGAALGLAKNLVFSSTGGILGTIVGGPLTGALLGAGASMVTKSQAFQEMLYGRDEYDEEGNVTKHVNGILEKVKGPSKESLERAKSMGLTGAIGGGLLGTLAGGPLVGAMIGAATGIASSSDKFQDFLFGEKDENGNRNFESGAFGRIKNFINASVFQPLKNSLKNFGVMIGHHMKYSIFEPLRIALSPLTTKLRDAASNVKFGAKNLLNFLSMPFKWIGKKIYNDFFKGKIGTAIGGFVRFLVGVPKKIFGGIANAFRGINEFNALAMGVGHGANTAIKNTIGTKGLLNFANIGDKIKENTRDEDGNTKVGLSGVGGVVKGLGSGIWDNLKHVGKIVTNYKEEGEEEGTFMKAVRENGGTGIDEIWSQISDNERKRKADFERIRSNYDYDRALLKYQNAISAATGYKIPLNDLGIFDSAKYGNDLFGTLKEQAMRQAEKHNTGAAGILNHKSWEEYYQKSLDKLQKSTKKTQEILGVDSFFDINGAIMQHVDPRTGKTVKQLWDERQGNGDATLSTNNSSIDMEESSRREAREAEERQYRNDVIDTFGSVDSNISSILNELVTQRANSIARETGEDPTNVKTRLNDEIGTARTAYNNTPGSKEDKAKAAESILKTKNNEVPTSEGKSKISILNENIIPTGDSQTSDIWYGPEGYADGTDNAERGVRVVGERGPELVRFRGGERVTPSHMIDKALGKSYKSDYDMMKSDGKNLSLEERILSTILSIRSVIVGQDPTKTFDINKLRTKVDSVTSAVGNGLNTVGGLIGGAYNGILSILPSPVRNLISSIVNPVVNTAKFGIALGKHTVNGVKKTVGYGKEFISDVSKVASGGKKIVKGAASAVNSIGSSIGSFFNRSNELSEDENGYDDTSRASIVDHDDSLLSNMIDASAGDEDAREDLKDDIISEERARNAERSYLDVSSRSFQNHEKERRETEQAEISTAATLEANTHLAKIATGQKEHSLSWSSIFGPKGKLTLALLLIAPLAIKLFRKLANFNFDDIGGSVASALSSVVGGFGTGIQSAFNTFMSTFKTQTENGNTDKDGNLVSNGESTISTVTDNIDDNINIVEDAADFDIMSMFNDAYLGSHGDVVGNEHMTTETESVNKFQAKTLSKFLSKGIEVGNAIKSGVSKLGGVVDDGAKLLKNAGTSISDTVLRAHNNVLDPNVTAKVSDEVIDAVATKASSGWKAFTEAMKKLGEKIAGSNVGKRISKSVITSSIDDGVKLAANWATKIAKGVGKVLAEAAALGTTIVGYLAKESTWVIFGAINNGLSGAAKLFGVSPADVDDDMKLIAAVIGGFFGTTPGAILDVAFSIAAQAGADILGTIVSFIYVAMAEDSKKAAEKLANAQENWQDIYKENRRRELETQTNTYNITHGTNYTPEEFEELAASENKGADDPTLQLTDYTDWNADANSTFFGYMWNNITTDVHDAISDDYEATYTAPDGTEYRYVRNDKGRFDVYDMEGNRIGEEATLPSTARMTTADQQKYKKMDVTNSQYGDTVYFSKDGKKYYIYNGESFDEYSTSTNKRTGMFGTKTITETDFESMILSGSIVANKNTENLYTDLADQNTLLSKYGRGKVFENLAGYKYMLDDEYYYGTNGQERWIEFDDQGNFTRFILDSNDLTSLHGGIEQGAIKLIQDGDYDITAQSSVKSDSRLENGAGTLEKYLATIKEKTTKHSSYDEITESNTVNDIDDGGAALPDYNQKEKNEFYKKYASKDWYDSTGFMYRIDEDLYNKTGQVAFLKYSPLGDYVDYFSSGSKTFNNIINGIDDGSFTTSNPLDNRDSELTKSVERNIGEMSEDELARYLEGAEKAFEENDLGSEYDEMYNGTLFSNMDYKDVAWMLPSTGAYYIKTDKGFDAYNAQGCLIGSINDPSKVAAIYMEIETGILERGTPVNNNTKQNVTSGGNTIASAKNLQAPTYTLAASPSSELNSVLYSKNTSDVTGSYNNVQDSVIIKDEVKEANENYTEEYLQKDLNGDGEIGNGSNSSNTKNNNKSSNSTNSSSSSDKESKDFQGLSSTPFGLKGGSGETVNGHNYLSQYDSRWRNSSYKQTSGEVDSTSAEMTVGARGCGPTALAMVANQLNGTDLKPTDLTRVAENYGYSDETGTNWSFMNDVPSVYGLDSEGMQNPTSEFIDTSLSMNRPVILSGSSTDKNSPYTSAGHYVVAVGKSKNGNYLINDPRGEEYSHEYTPESVIGENDSTAAWSLGSLRRKFSNGGNGLVSRAKSILKNRNRKRLNRGGKGSIRENIVKYAPIAQEVWRTCGILPSVTMGQLIQETSFGTNSAAHGLPYNNWLGHGYAFGKNTPYCAGKYSHKTKASGTHPSEWCKYNSPEDCIRNHGYVLSGQSGNTRYLAAVGVTDPSKAIRIIQDAGYCKAPYADRVIHQIKTYNLTQYDTGTFNGVIASPGSGTTSTSSGNPNAINSPYRGKFRMSQEFIGTKYSTQIQKSAGYEHDGYDLVGIDDKTLYATVPGVVVKAGWESESDHSKGFGQYVKIQKNGNEDEFYYYGHMSEVLVKQGDVVDYGTPIGIEGSTGKSTGPHCHYCIRSANTGYLDITTISNIPNVKDTYEDNGEYGAGGASSTALGSEETTTTVKEQTIFEKLITGLTNLAGRVVNGLATGEWDTDWSTLLGQSQTMSVVNQNTDGISTVDLGQDYIGKYIKEFESGSEGSAAVSDDYSFGTFQFPSSGKSIADKNSSLYQFWNKYYASTNSDVTPGKNAAFVERWKQLASSDPDGFFTNEYQFCYDNYYKQGLSQSNVVGTVNPDLHRSSQESFWSTMIQFGPDTNCWADGHSGMTDTTDETTMINDFQEYKANRLPSSADRHRNGEKNVLLNLVGKSPIDHSSLDAGGKGDDPRPKYSGYSNKETAKRVLLKRNSKLKSVKPLLEKLGITNAPKAGMDELGYHPQIGGKGVNSYIDRETLSQLQLNELPIDIGNDITNINNNDESKVESSYISNSNDKVNDFTYYSQNDERWSDATYEQTAGIPGTDDETMSSRGCGPTALAMVAEGLTGDTVTPTDAAELAEKYGYSDESGTNWDYMSNIPNYYGLSSTGVENPSRNFIDTSLSLGRPVVLSGYSSNIKSPYTSGGHYVVAVGKTKNGKYLINDPRGKNYSHEYDASIVADNASAAWSINKSYNKNKYRDEMLKRRYEGKYSKGGRGMGSTAFIEMCSKVCANICKHGWTYGMGVVQTYDVDGKQIKSRCDCSGMVSAALMYLGIIDTPYSSGDYANGSLADKLSSGMGYKFVKSSSMSDSDWDNLPAGTIVSYNGHVEVLMGWHTKDNGRQYAIVYSGGSGPSKVGYRTAYAWKEGMTSVQPYKSDWSKSSYIKTFTGLYVPTDAGASLSSLGISSSNIDSSSSTGTTISSVANVLDMFLTGTTNLAARTWEGLGTDYWNNDWSTITGSSATISGTENASLTSNASSSTGSEYDVTYPSNAPDFSGNPTKSKFMDIMIGGGAIQSGINGGIFPSVKLGQAAFESGWAQSRRAVNDHALYGIKDGNGNFKKYNSYAESIADHTKLLNNNNYGPSMKSSKNYKEMTQNLINCGYCKDPGYYEQMTGIIEANDFAYFDTDEAINYYKSLSPSGSGYGRDIPMGGKGDNNTYVHRNIDNGIDSISNVNIKQSSQSSSKLIDDNIYNQSLFENMNTEKLEALVTKVITILTSINENTGVQVDKLDELSINNSSNNISVVSSTKSSNRVSNKNTRSRSEILARALAKA